MSKAEFWQRGEALDYINSTNATIPNNTLVQIGDHLGVTGTTIEPGQTGSLHVGGVWEIKKTGTAAITMGQTVYFDGTGITDAKDDGATTNPTGVTIDTPTVTVTGDVIASGVSLVHHTHPGDSGGTTGQPN